MKNRILIFICLTLCLFCLVSCLNRNEAANGYFSYNGIYLGFENLPEYKTAQDALEDGCFTVVSESDNGGALYGGSEYWTKFYEDSKNGMDAFLRIVHFIDGEAYFADLIYTDGGYRYFDFEYEDLSDRPYQYLRALTGMDGSPKKEVTWYVLTDSPELTYQEASRRFYSSSMKEIESIPDFRWLGFTTYLNK